MSIPIEQAISEYFAAIRAMDVERVVKVFAPEAELHDPVGTPPKLGRETIRAFFLEIFTSFRLISLIEDVVYANGCAAAVKWTGKVIGSGGNSVAFEGIDVIECNEAGQVTVVRAFWNSAPVMAILET